MIGRNSGSVPGYPIRQRTRTRHHMGRATFREYIKDPKAKIPGTKMIYAGLKDDKRPMT